MFIQLKYHSSLFQQHPFINLLSSTCSGVGSQRRSLCSEARHFFPQPPNAGEDVFRSVERHHFSSMSWVFLWFSFYCSLTLLEHLSEEMSRGHLHLSLHCSSAPSSHQYLEQTRQATPTCPLILFTILASAVNKILGFLVSPWGCTLLPTQRTQSLQAD